MVFVPFNMLIVFSILILVYVFFTALLYFFWLKIPVFESNSIDGLKTKLSVLIAIRNESKSIGLLLQDLELQSYPKENFEVIILDDHSDDFSAQVVEEFIKTSKMTIHLVKMDAGVFGKKKAIAKGVEKAAGKLIVTTDGDCRVGENWLLVLENFYRVKKVKMITGGVTFHENSLWKDKMFTIEFASLVGSGAASLAMGYPNMCNGANLAYEKQVFIEVNGFDGTEGLASGDDEFLMHKIHKQYPGKVLFIKNKASIVETSAPETWRLFIEQRKRWASKWENYTFTHIKALALLIFASNLSIVLGFLLSWLDNYPLGIFLAILLFKIILEFLFLQSILVYFGRKLTLSVFLLVELVYPFYVVFFALLGRTKKYNWKNREIG